LKKNIVALGLAAILVACGILLRPSIGQDKKEIVKVHFAPTGKDENIQKVIIEQLKDAREEIVVAMFMFTSDDLAKTLRSMGKRVRVRLLMDKNQWGDLKKQHHSVIDVLSSQEVNVKLVDLKGDARFHHKFTVIDRKTVVTGSYNWTIQGDKDNYENILIIEDANLAAQYFSEFERIWKGPNAQDR
jgi:cardiolipin hydrolase